MVATIRLSPYILVQGKIERQLPDGCVAIRDGGSEYIGQPLMAIPGGSGRRTENSLGH